jgi:hypothetical protein
MRRKPIVWVAATIALIALFVGLFGSYGHYIASRDRKREQIRELETRMRGIKVRATSQVKASGLRDTSDLRDMKEEFTQLDKDRGKLQRELRESDVRTFFSDLFLAKPRSERRHERARYECPLDRCRICRHTDCEAHSMPRGDKPCPTASRLC